MSTTPAGAVPFHYGGNCFTTESCNSDSLHSTVERSDHAATWCYYAKWVVWSRCAVLAAHDVTMRCCCCVRYVSRSVAPLSVRPSLDGQLDAANLFTDDVRPAVPAIGARCRLPNCYQRLLVSRGRPPDRSAWSRRIAGRRQIAPGDGRLDRCDVNPQIGCKRRWSVGVARSAIV